MSAAKPKKMWMLMKGRERLWHTLAPTKAEAYSWLSEYAIIDGHEGCADLCEWELEEFGYRFVRVLVEVVRSDKENNDA